LGAGQNLATIERPAYEVSDKTKPEYIWFGDHVLGRGNNGDPDGKNVQPLPIERLLKTVPGEAP